MTHKTKRIVRMAAIAALYAAVTYAAYPISYGGVQFRLSEALLILAAFSAEAVPGLAIGCVIANLGSPAGLADVVIGSAATLAAALVIRLLSRRKQPLFLLCAEAALAAALLNGAAVGAEIVLFTAPSGAGLTAFWAAALWIALGEAAVCGILCYPLARLIRANRPLSRFFITEKERERL